jgi:hypothetical protein
MTIQQTPFETAATDFILIVLRFEELTENEVQFADK